MVVSVKDDPFVQTRTGMVEQQLKAEGITDPLVLTAMEQIPRHLFILPSELPVGCYSGLCNGRR